MTSQSKAAAPSRDQDEVPVVPDDQFNDSSKRREWLSGLKTAFSVVEGIAGIIPVAGTYVGAAAKTGATIIDIIQVRQCGSDSSLLLTGALRKSMATKKRPKASHITHFSCPAF